MDRSPIAVALNRKVTDKDQRIVVVGGSQFLSNQYVGLLSNLDLGTNMLNWLSRGREPDHGAAARDGWTASSI